MLCVAVVLEEPVADKEPEAVTKAKNMYRSCLNECKNIITYITTYKSPLYPVGIVDKQLRLLKSQFINRLNWLRV